MNLNQHTTGPSDPQAFLGGEMGERIRALDWGTTSLGAMDRWPRSLRTLIDMLLAHPLPMIVLWGPDLIQIYNDGYARIVGRKHPEALSMPTRQCWPEVWHVNGPIYERVLRRGESVLLEDQSFPTTRSGALEDARFTLTYSPVRDDNGRIGGVLLTILETTAKVIAEREGRYQEDHRAATQRTLRESEEQFRTLISATSDIVYRISRDWSEIRLLQGREFLPDAVESSRSWLEKCVHPDDRPRVLDTINRAIADKSDFEVEHRVIRVDGSLGWTYSRAIPIVDAQGEIVEWFGTASDITARKEAEEVLRRSHERAQILADAISQLLYSDAPQAVIQSLGERVMEHLGCHLFLNYVVDQEEDCLLLNACSGIPDEAVAGISRLDYGVAVCGCVARDGQPIVAECVQDTGDPRNELVKSMGARAYACHPLRDPQGRVFGALSFGSRSRDAFANDELELMETVANHAALVIGRKRAAEALRESEQKYRTLFDSIDEGFCTFDMIFDDAGVPVDYRFVECNQAFERHTGLTGAVGRTVREFLPDQDRHWFEIYGRVAMTGEPVRVSRYGEALKRWIEVYAFRIGDPEQRRVAALFSDVTKRKNVELALQASEERQAFLLRVSDALRLQSDPEQIMHVAGKHVTEHLGVSGCYFNEVDESRGEVSVQLGWAVDGVPRLNQTYRLADYLTDEFLRAGRRGETFVVCDTSSNPHTDAANFARLQIGAFIAVSFLRQGRWVAYLTVTNPTPRDWREDEIEVLREVSHRIFPQIERARAEVALRELTETLEQQVAERTAVVEQRARALRRLAAELNEAEHRERKRLARLLHDNLQQLLVAARFRLQVVLSGDQSEREKHVQHMDQLLQECAATSRNLMQELSPPILQMGTLTEILEWLGTWCAEKHGLMTTVETDDDIPPVPEHIRVFVFQAVREMLFNVVKHSGAKQACVDIFARSGTLLVQVQDGGNGFDPQILDAHLLHPEGFGLFHIRERLEALGGRLEFRAAPGDGARFRIVLPIAEGDGSPLDASPVRRVKTPGRSQERPKDTALRLLIVDDHAVVREGFIRLLDRQPDITVVGEAADGEQAVHQAAMLRPDVILMDVNMPGMNGFEATRRIKARQPDVVVIGLSLDEDKSVERAMREAEADGYVSKQVSAKELLEVLRRACRHISAD